MLILHEPDIPFQGACKIFFVGSSSSTIRLGRLFAEARRGKGISQESLAVQLGTEQSTISRLESGQRKQSIEEFVRWCSALGLSKQERMAFLSEIEMNLNLE